MSNSNENSDAAIKQIEAIKAAKPHLAQRCDEGIKQIEALKTNNISLDNETLAVLRGLSNAPSPEEAQRVFDECMAKLRRAS